MEVNVVRQEETTQKAVIKLTTIVSLQGKPREAKLGLNVQCNKHGRTHPCGRVGQLPQLPPE
jgi:hypothetical protein